MQSAPASSPARTVRILRPGRYPRDTTASAVASTSRCSSSVAGSTSGLSLRAVVFCRESISALKRLSSPSAKSPSSTRDCRTGSAAPAAGQSRSSACSADMGKVRTCARDRTRHAIADRVTPIAPVLALVEQQHLGPAEQGGGQGESLAHAEREPAGTLPGGDLEPDDREDLVDPPYRDAAQRSGGPTWSRAVRRGACTGRRAPIPRRGLGSPGRCNGRRRSGPRPGRGG